MAKSNASHLSPSDRAPKRPKFISPVAAADSPQDDNNAATAAVATPTLAPELWAHTLDFLPYESVLQTASVSRSMLHEVMPLVTTLHINKSTQLHAGAIASRYRDVRDIYIYSLIDLNLDGEGGWILDHDTATRAVPFLCSFPRLERVFLGGLDEWTDDSRRPTPSGRLVIGFMPHLFENTGTHSNWKRMTALIDAFSGAFRAGALSNKLWVAGLRCPYSNSRRNLFDGDRIPCLNCSNACKSWPLDVAIDFEHEGRMEDRERKYGRTAMYSDHIYGLDVCLTGDQIETIIKSRPGGRELLYSQERLMTLLGRGTRHVIVTDDDKELYVVKFEQEDLDAMQHVIKKASINVQQLSSEDVTDAIRRSFTGDERDPLPPREQCYLAGTTFYKLKVELGLPLEEADFLNEDEWPKKDSRERKSIYPSDPHFAYNWRFW